MSNLVFLELAELANYGSFLYCINDRFSENSASKIAYERDQ